MLHCGKRRYATRSEVVLQVEQDGFCKKVIRARMADGMAHVGSISADIQEFKPPVMKAGGLLGGFPCGDPWTVCVGVHVLSHVRMGCMNFVASCLQCFLRESRAPGSSAAEIIMKLV